MIDARNGRLNYIAVIGLIVCVCVAGYHRQRPALPQSKVSLSFDGGFLEPTATVDASSPEVEEQTAAMNHRSVRPLFGMEMEPALGDLASKWRAVEFEISHEEKVLAGCRAQKPCPEPARDLLNIIAEGINRTGRTRVGLINRAVDLAITPTADEAQWGVEDHWSSPFETLQTHRGDCEDYAIVKYVALREAGLSNADVKIVILRNLLPNEYHAVAAARVNGEWLILDNRRLTLVRDTDMTRATPIFQLDEDGVHRFVPSNHTVQRRKASPYTSEARSSARADFYRLAAAGWSHFGFD
jgi:predicted transglutaminase-like cysteine proteinase